MTKLSNAILYGYKDSKKGFILIALFLSLSIVTIYYSIIYSYYLFLLSIPLLIFTIFCVKSLTSALKSHYERHLEDEIENEERKNMSAEEKKEEAEEIQKRAEKIQKRADEARRNSMDSQSREREFIEKKRNHEDSLLKLGVELLKNGDKIIDESASGDLTGEITYDLNNIELSLYKHLYRQFNKFLSLGLDDNEIKNFESVNTWFKENYKEGYEVFNNPFYQWNFNFLMKKDNPISPKEVQSYLQDDKIVTDN